MYAIKVNYERLPSRYLTRVAADVDAALIRADRPKAYVEVVRMLDRWDRVQRDKAKALREAADAVGAELWENDTIPCEVAKWLRKRADGIIWRRAREVTPGANK